MKSVLKRHTSVNYTEYRLAGKRLDKLLLPFIFSCKGGLIIRKPVVNNYKLSSANKSLNSCLMMFRQAAVSFAILPK